MPDLNQMDPLDALRTAPGAFAPQTPPHVLRRRGRRRAQLHAAGALSLGLAVLGIGVAVAVAPGQSDQLVPVEPAPSPSATAAPTAAPSPAPTPTTTPTKAVAPAPTKAPVGLAAGTYEVRVLAEGWDAQGKHLIVDVGEIVVGEPSEPGVDSTRAVSFDTGRVVERERVDLAAAHGALQFNRTTPSEGQSSYGPGEWPDLVTEISGRDKPMLATIRVNDRGEFLTLTEPYRP